MRWYFHILKWACLLLGAAATGLGLSLAFLGDWEHVIPILIGGLTILINGWVFEIQGRTSAILDSLTRP